MEANGDSNGHYDYAPPNDPNTLPSLQHQTEPAQHPAAASEPAKPKRAHVQAACIFCKGRKMRCDGAKPGCANCVNRKLACEYPEPPTRTRAPRAANGDGSPTPSKRKLQQQQQQQQQQQAAEAAAAHTMAMRPIQYHPMTAPMYYYPPVGPDGTILAHAPPPHHYLPQPPPPPPRRMKRSASEMDGEDDGAPGDGDYQAHMGGMTNGASGVKKRTGKRATMACHSCRSRKLKCDECMPACSQCQRRNLPCAYDDQVRRRGPSKRKRSNDPDGPSPEPQQPPQPHTHPLGVIPIPGPDGTKFMQMVDQNGVPVHYMVSMDPNAPQQLVPMHAPGMHLAEDHENGHTDGSPHTAQDLSPHTQDNDDLAEQHPAAPPVIWS